MTAQAFAVAMAALGVNGPEDVVSWDAVNWRLHEDNVRRLRQRIFTAVVDGDWPKVRNLQKLLLRSWSNTLVSVRQATQRNAGRRRGGRVEFPGQDGPRGAGAPVHPILAAPCG